MPTRTGLKAYTLAGYVPFLDEFGEDVFVDLGKMFLEDFTESLRPGVRPSESDCR